MTYDEDFRPKVKRSPWLRFVLYWLSVAAMMALLGLILYLITGCSTVTPKPVAATQASYDGNEANSGILGFMADASVHITENARARYNDLIDVYGRDFDPPLRHDSGVTQLPDHTYTIDRQHAVDFEVMAAKKRSGIKPHQ